MSRRSLNDGSGNFMAKDARIGDHWILASIGVEVTSTKANQPHLEKNILPIHDGIMHLLHYQLARLFQ
jgi:hypothetical protein